MKDVKTFTLQELAKVNIDSWTEAVSLMDDIEAVRREACESAELPNDNTTDAPDLVPQYEYIARRDEFLFDEQGEVVSYNKMR